MTVGIKNLVLNFSWDENIEVNDTEKDENTEDNGNTEDDDMEEDDDIKFDDEPDKPVLSEDMKKFVGFMGVIIDFVKTEFTIFGHTFSYWQIIVLSCIGSIVGVFIGKLF